MNEEQKGGRRRRSRAEVERLVAECEASGLSQSEFCRQRGLGLSTLARHRKRRKQQAAMSRSPLLAVEVTGPPQTRLAATGAPLAVVLRGGRRIEVGREFDAGVLEQLVRALEGV